MTAHDKPTIVSPTSFAALDEGEFADACEVCGTRPTSIRVVQWASAAGTAPVGEIADVLRRYYCAEHQGAAAERYEEYRRA